jgi:hypothetical protein
MSGRAADRFTIQTSLRVISAFLVASVVIQFGLMRSLEKSGEITSEFLASSILYEVGSMNRATLALAEFRTTVLPSGTEADWVAQKSEQCRLLLSHASIPSSVDQTAVQRFLREDPLLLVDRIGGVEEKYRIQVASLTQSYDALVAAGSVKEKVEAIASFESRLPAYRIALLSRAQLLEQLEVTAHAQLASDQAAAIRRLTLGVVGQAFLVLLAIVVAVLIFRSHASQVRTLQGLIPICSACKKVRDDAGFWASVEAYLASRTDATFTHGVCPECMTKLYPDFSRDEHGR